MAASLDMFVSATHRYGKPEFDIHDTIVDGETVSVIEEVVVEKPFCNLVHFRRQGAADRNDPPVLIVAPMSGHFATLLRGTVEAMLPDSPKRAPARMEPNPLREAILKTNREGKRVFKEPHVVMKEFVEVTSRKNSTSTKVTMKQAALQLMAEWLSNAVELAMLLTLPSAVALFITGSAKERDRQREAMRRNASVLDGIREQALDFRRTLGRNDQLKLDEYFDSVRAVETQMQMSRGWIDRPKPKVDFRMPSGPQAFTQQMPLFYDLIALALQTDSTRVATLSIPGTLPVGDLGLSGSYHAFSHHGQDPRLRGGLLTIEKFQMQQFARFVNKLAAIEHVDRPLDNVFVTQGYRVEGSRIHGCCRHPPSL